MPRMAMHLHADRGVALASFNECAQTSRTSPLTNLKSNLHLLIQTTRTSSPAISLPLEVQGRRVVEKVALGKRVFPQTSISSRAIKATGTRMEIRGRKTNCTKIIGT